MKRGGSQMSTETSGDATSGALSRSAIFLVSLVAVATGYVALRTRLHLWRTEPRLHILEYHEVDGDQPETEGVVSAARFRRHIRYLKKYFRLETLSRALELLRLNHHHDRSIVAVTFDDGLAGNYRWAWPVLRQENVPATIFLTTGFVDGEALWFDFARRALEAARRDPSRLPNRTRRVLTSVYGEWPRNGRSQDLVEQLKRLSPDRRNDVLESLRSAGLRLETTARPMSWAQVREMQAAGIEIGGHTMTHPILSMLSRGEQEAEIDGCRKRIAKETGVEPRTFAVPNGSLRDFNETTIEILRATGFEASCTTIRGPNRPGCDPYRLKRIGVGSDPTVVLAARLAGVFDEGLRRKLRRVGWRR